MKKEGKKDEEEKRVKRGKAGKEKRKGLSTVVITLIVILVSLVAIGTIWVVVKNVIQKSAEQVSIGQFTLDAQIMGLRFNNVSNNVFVTVKRNPGSGEINSLDFIFFGEGENSEVATETTSLIELEEKTFDIHLNNISVYNLTSVTIAQSSTQDGTSITEVLDSYEVNQETVPHIVVLPIDPSLVLWLKFDDDLSDKKTTDSSNYTRNVTCADIITCPTYLSTGGVDGSGAYDFDGINDSMTILTPLVNPAVWTYAAWFYPKSNANATSAIIGQGNNPALRWITLTPTTRRVYLFLAWSYSPGYKQIASPDLALNQWHHAVGIVNLTDPVNQTMYLYIDGVRVASVFWINGTITRPSSGHYLNIRDSARTFNGSMDNIRVYNRGLSESEILLFNSTKT